MKRKNTNYNEKLECYEGLSRCPRCHEQTLVIADKQYNIGVIYAEWCLNCSYADGEANF